MRPLLATNLTETFLTDSGNLFNSLQNLWDVPLTKTIYTLLNASDGAPVAITNPTGNSPVLLICEHASLRIPASLDALGLDTNSAKSHVAWDPGAMAVSEMLSQQLNATLISARFSRLVYDCNRPPASAEATRDTSEVFNIPGNRDIPTEQRAARVDEIYNPFVDTIQNYIATEIANGRPPVLVTIHSFTPVYFGKIREVELGVLHDTDTRLADEMLAIPSEMNMQRNQPYGPQDEVTHTLRLHALPNGLLNVMIEIRNDLLADKAGQQAVADDLANRLTQAIAALEVTNA